MELTLSGKQTDVKVTKAIYEEYAAARCDALQLLLFDESEEIRQMNLRKGDIISASADQVKTGEMYISEISYCKSDVSIRALSLKTECFTEKSFYRNNISFIEMVREIEAETGCRLNLINQLNCSYIDVTRTQQNPITYLAQRLRLEGFQIRINDNRLIIYDERQQEEKEPVDTYEESDFIGFPEYSTKDAHLIESITNTYKSESGYTIKTCIESEIKGKNLETSIAVSSIAESERFSRGLLREANKYEYLTVGSVNGLKRKTGQSIDLNCDFTDYAGKNYIYAIKHDLIDESQRLYMRKPIKGDY